MSGEVLFSMEPTQMEFGLSPLEKQVTALILVGDPKQDVAVKLGMSEATLRRHITSLYDKLCVSNDFELLLYAAYHGLLKTTQYLARII